jgi:hypothetical protein
MDGWRERGVNKEKREHNLERECILRRRERGERESKRERGEI